MLFSQINQRRVVPPVQEAAVDVEAVFSVGVIAGLSGRQVGVGQAAVTRHPLPLTLHHHVTSAQPKYTGC